MENTLENTDWQEPEPHGPGQTVDDGGVPVSGSRVLVVAADSESRWAHVGVLRDAGARVAEARDGKEALALARESLPDIVVADAELPDIEGPELRVAFRQESELDQVPVVILGDALPPTGNSHVAGRALAEAVVALLEERRLESDVPDPVAAREDLRAQSTVSMYRQPANHVPRSSHPVWRLQTSTGEPGARTVSGFDSELHVMSRVLGAGFVAMAIATVGLIGWQLAATGSVETEGAATEGVAADATPEESGSAAPAQDEPTSGLIDAVDPALGVGPGQGVLELSGSSEVRVAVDGIDRGSLPVTLVLDQGRHRLRYEFEGRRSVRFTFVKADATRSIGVVTRPGGFVDAR